MNKMSLILVIIVATVAVAFSVLASDEAGMQFPEKQGESDSFPSKSIGWAIFRDVPETHWAEEKINFLAQNRQLYGYSDDTFRPDQMVTRAEMASMLVNAARENTAPPERPTFKDVTHDQWFYSTVEAAKNFFAADESLGEGMFRPDDPATRQEAVAALVRAKKIKYDGGDPLAVRAAFSDYDSILPEYRMAIVHALKNSLVSGYPDRTFRPAAPLTRAEAASLIYNAFYSEINIETLIKTGRVKFFDKSQEEFSETAGILDRRFGKWEGVDLSFRIKEIQVGAGGSDRLLLVFARVDPFKYFTFTDAVFRPDPPRLLEYAGSVAGEVSRSFPDRRNLVIVGFYDFVIYDTAPDVYGRDHCRYSPDEGGWNVERFYAGVMSLYGRVTETWLDQKA